MNDYKDSVWGPEENCIYPPIEGCLPSIQALKNDLKSEIVVKIQSDASKFKVIFMYLLFSNIEVYIRVYFNKNVRKI